MKNKILIGFFIFGFFFLSGLSGFGQPLKLLYKSTKRMGGMSICETRSLIKDSGGNLYVVGHFYYIVDFGQDFGISDVKTSAGYDDVFMTKINADGSYGWTKRFGGAGNEDVKGIAVDSSGNVYIVGYFTQTVDFGQDFSVSDSKTSAGRGDAFLTKINANGTYGWTKRFGNTEGECGYGVAVDSSGNVYIVGIFEISVNFGQDFGTTDSKTSAGGSDVFVTKINANATYGWTKRFGGSVWDMGYAITVDSSGSIFLTGSFYYSVNFGQDFGANDSKSAVQLQDVFVTKFNVNATYGWTKRFGGTAEDIGRSIAVDASGNVYVTGSFQGAVNFGQDFGATDNKTSAGGDDGFVTKIYANAAYGWTRSIGGTGVDCGNGIAVDSSGNSYITGSFSNIVNFGQDFGATDNKTSAGDSDAFIIRINSGGAYGWTRRIGGTGTDIGHGIFSDASSNLNITGKFSNTVNFGQDFGVTDNKTASAASGDAFVTKLASAVIKCDFNGDGQEDILWRFYGGGPWQGWNAVWYLSQAGGDSVAALGMTPKGFAPRDLFPGPGPNEKYRSPLEAGGLLFKRPEKIRRDALEAADILKNKGEWQLDAADLKEVRIVRNPGEMGMGVQGKMKTAGLAISGSAYLQTIADMNWDIAGTGDFNRDGKTDILWRYYGSGSNQGANAVWYMNGVNYIGADWLMTITDTHWRIESTGDFNGDGKTDILWRYYGSGPDQGRNVIWYMDGANYIGAAMLITITDTNWRIEGTGDFNGDGKTDILWRYYGGGANQGMNGVWYMNGASYMSTDMLLTVTDTNWRIEGTGDFNGDGKTDIIWRYYGGDSNLGMNAIWYMNGANYIGADWLDTVADANWRIKNR